MDKVTSIARDWMLLMGIYDLRFTIDAAAPFELALCGPGGLEWLTLGLAMNSLEKQDGEISGTETRQELHNHSSA